MPANHKKLVKSNSNKKAAKKPANTHITVHKNHVILYAVAVLVVINLLLVVSLFKIQTLQASQNGIMVVNQKKSYNQVSIQVSDVKTETGYIMGIKPSQGEKIISAQITISNNSKEPFDFYPSIQTFVRDNQGVTYSMAPVELSNPFGATVVKPGEVKTGQLSYMVTDRPIPLFMYIESTVSGAAPFVVKIQ